jgi:hypothetical protein
MTISRALGWLVAIALTAAACATTVRVPEIPVLDSPSYKKAIREPDPKPSVKIIEVPKPLPLPGQLKPVPEKKDKTKDDNQPKDEKPPKSGSSRRTPTRGSSRSRTAISMPSRSIPTPRALSTSSMPAGYARSGSRPRGRCAGGRLFLCPNSEPV